MTSKDLIIGAAAGVAGTALALQSQQLPQPQTYDTSLLLQKLDGIENQLNEIRLADDALVQYASKSGGFNPDEKRFMKGYTTITTSTPNKPESEDVIACNDALLPFPRFITGLPGYDRVPIAEHNNNQNVPELNIRSVGTDRLFVRNSIDGQNFSEELTIEIGTVKRLLNVNTILIRAADFGVTKFATASPSAFTFEFPLGGVYELTENKVIQEQVNFNLTAWESAALTVPIAGVGQTGIVVLVETINLRTLIHAYVHNTGDIFVAPDPLGVADATVRITMSAGDALHLHLTAGAEMHFAGSVAGQIVELVGETNLLPAPGP